MGRSAGSVIRISAALLALSTLGLLAFLEGQGSGWPVAEGPAVSERVAFGKMAGPCADRELRRELRCPDLKMRKPFDLYFAYSPNGRLLLHAGNDIQSRGPGPLEVRGRKFKTNRMRSHQVIYRRGGGKLHRRPTGYLVFFPIPYQGSYWKYENAARFELWRLGKKGKPFERVRVGPKADYCFRDLERTMPSAISPPGPVYPACSQDPNISKVTLGTSVGWSDVYPAPYHQNLVNANGLRGCFLLRQLADPLNQISELREDNNVGARRVRLTGSPTPIRSC